MTELVVFGRDIVKNRMGGITRRISSANVPSDLSLLAFGIPPARKAESAGGMPKVPKGQGLGRLARWALYYFWGVSGGMPYTNDLDQLGFIIEAVNDSIGRDDHLVQILLIEFWNDSPHTRMRL